MSLDVGDISVQFKNKLVRWVCSCACRRELNYSRVRTEVRGNMFAQCFVCALTKSCKLFGMNCLIFDKMLRKCILFRFALPSGITFSVFFTVVTVWLCCVDKEFDFRTFWPILILKPKFKCIKRKTVVRL